MSSSVLTFVIVGHEDHPIFEADLSNKAPDGTDRAQYLHQFVLHSSLDAVEEHLWGSSAMFLNVVDRYNHLQVSAYVTAAQVKFLLLHDGRSEESVRSFFRDVYEVYLRVMMNPFFAPTSRIASPSFAQRVREKARLYFRA